MRTRNEIEDEYKVTAMIYGDRMFRVTQLEEEVENLSNKMASLLAEQAILSSPPTLMDSSKSASE